VKKFFRFVFVVFAISFVFDHSRNVYHLWTEARQPDISEAIFFNIIAVFLLSSYIIDVIFNGLGSDNK